jgi:hypothetical protein
MILEKEIKYTEHQHPDGTLHTTGSLEIVAFASLPGAKARDLEKLEPEGRPKLRAELREDIEQRLTARVYGPLVEPIKRLSRLAARVNSTEADAIKLEIARLIGRAK